jgi:hypothetical protein
MILLLLLFICACGVQGGAACDGDADLSVNISLVDMDDEQLKRKIKSNEKMNVMLQYEQNNIRIGGQPPNDPENQLAHIIFNASRWEYLKSDTVNQLLLLDLRSVKAKAMCVNVSPSCPIVR